MSLFYFLPRISGSSSFVFSLLASGLLLGSLLDNGETDTSTTGKGNKSLLTLSNGEDILNASGEGVTSKILNGDDGVVTRVLLDVLDDTDTTQVATRGDHGEVTNSELNVVSDLASLEADLEGIVNLDIGVRVADGAAIVSANEGNTSGTNLGGFDLAELVAGLLRLDAVKSKSALDVVQKAELLVGLVDGDNICNNE